MQRTGFVTAPVFLRHDTGASHPERAARVTAVLHGLEASGLGAELELAEASEAPLEVVERVHDPEYLAALRAAIARGVTVLDRGDTVVSADSWSAALTAVGAAVTAGEQVVRGEWSNAFCCVRPPGHHAERAEAMGFCLFDNVAVLARHLQAAHGLERVAILDWDVHHGNGTQHLFEEDPSVFFASLHQYPFYPGTGAASERGRGAGEGATLNCPLPAGAGDLEWLTALEHEALPAIEAFRPDMLLISAGFDAHERDPLGGTNVTTEGFREFTRLALDLARRTCGGRLVSLLEGGYDLEALSASVHAHLEVLHAG